MRNSPSGDEDRSLGTLRGEPLGGRERGPLRARRVGGQQGAPESAASSGPSVRIRSDAERAGESALSRRPSAVTGSLTRRANPELTSEQRELRPVVLPELPVKARDV